LNAQAKLIQYLPSAVIIIALAIANLITSDTPYSLSA